MSLVRPPVGTTGRLGAAAALTLGSCRAVGGKKPQGEPPFMIRKLSRTLRNNLRANHENPWPQDAMPTGSQS